MKKEYILEFVGTAFLIIFGCGSACFSYSAIGEFGVAASFAVTFVFWYCLTKSYYLCNLNPIISVACYYHEKINFRDCMFYILFQFLGALLGSIIVLLLALLTSNGLLSLGNMLNGFDNYSALKVTIIGAFIFEFIMSMTLVLVFVWTLIKFKKNKFSVILFTLVYFVLIVVGFKITGACYNPARAFGPAVMIAGSGDFIPLLQFLLFLIATFLGGLLGSFISKKFFMFSVDKKANSVDKTKLKTKENSDDVNLGSEKKQR